MWSHLTITNIFWAIVLGYFKWNESISNLDNASIRY